MARRRRSFRGGRTRGQVIPKVSPTHKSAMLMWEIHSKWPQRAEDAQTYFLIDVGNFMFNEILDRAPEISAAGGRVDYAKKLRLGLVEDGEAEDVIAIYLDGSDFEVAVDDLDLTVLYFRPRVSSPEWITVLARYGPWPSILLPVKVSSEDSETISRRARPDEVASLSAVLFQNKTKIEAHLRSAGAPDPEIGDSENAVGLSVKEDLGYNVLRRELGMDGEMQESHWRPAFRATKKYAGESLIKVVKYIKDGNKNVFNLPSGITSVSESVVREGMGFSKEIAPFLK